MANYFNLTLDTTGPANPSIAFAGAFATAQLQTVTIGTSDGTTTSYQMKIWGNVDPTYDANVQTTEGGSTWITYATSKQIKLSTGDGLKTINIKIRDDVANESSLAQDTVTLDMTAPIVNITAGPTVTRVSLQTGNNTCQVTWSADADIDQYIVKVVPAIDSDNTAGTAIGTAGGSTNVSGSSAIPSGTGTTTTIKGSDLQTASSGDGVKIVKVFVRDSNTGLWSV
jgi:hypothetical protein